MNSSDLVVITSFPPQGIVHDKAVVGIASYAKNTLLALKKYKNDLNITVLAEKLEGNSKTYEDNGLKVERIWRRNSFSTFFLLLKKIMSLKDTKNILIEFEVAMFGDFIYLLFFPLFLLILKLLRKKTTIVSHQVISDINSLSGHINLNDGLKTKVLNLFIHLFYKMLIAFSTKVIVFDQVLKEKLEKYGNKKKIFVIPHGVEKFNFELKNLDAKEKLGFKKDDFVLLYFGYLAWYKGTDILINYFNQIKEKANLKLIIAGGPNPNHLDKQYYLNYIKNIKEACEQNNIVLTGFVKEEDIPLYFIASDLVVFPYRTLMSASGPLSIAFSFQKPIIISNSLTEMFKTQDIKTGLDAAKLNEEDLVFNSSTDFQAKITRIHKDSNLRERLEMLSSIMGEQRSWEKVGQSYYETLFK